MSVPPPTKMAQPFLHDFKKQASFFLREKIKTARLALTDVTPAQLLAEEATSGGQGSPDTRTLKMISRAAFEIDDYWRITEIMHKRLERFDRKNWRVSYQALIVLEHLMTHGPESVSKEFQTAQDVIQQMGNFQFIDERGFNWGLNVRKKSERVLQLLENGKLLKEERDKARKITRGIEGFGSFSHRTHAAAEGVKEESTPEPYRKCNSLFIDDGKQEDDTKSESPTISWSGSDDSSMNGSSSSASTLNSFKENMALEEDEEEVNEWSGKGELNPLLSGQITDSRTSNSQEEDHPFTDEPLSTVSLLSASDRILQAC
ncbi:epsin-3 [Ipomoea triloba]|uniref:epsin-3 n=1 Tax=Ipomoea triloba TaxID=35885 RepID=UPI00125D76AA|nr:epsin-3 [Ipomoea triloba]